MSEIYLYLRSRTVVFVHDLLTIPIAWFGAYWLRFNLDLLPEGYFHQALVLLPVVWLAQGAMFWYFGLYRGIWRFASIPDLVRILKAVTAGVVIAAAASFILTRLHGVPRSVFILDGILLVLLLGGPRFIYRLFKDHSLYQWAQDRSLTGSTNRKNALIVGAGKAGETLARDLLRDSSGLYLPVAFADDDRGKIGKEIHGIPIAGSCFQIPQIVTRVNADLIIIALPTATSRQIRRIVEICETTGLPFRILPQMQDLVSGRASLKDLRDVRIEDLLGREPVELDWRAITEATHGKTVLVTGGGGSIGAELCRQLARLDPARLIILDRSEFNLYSIDIELRKSMPDLALTSLLVDVSDAMQMEKILRAHVPTVIYHAAAYKHVPILEDQARAAVANNVLGTRVVASLAEKSGCESFVMVSTDKAVNPANVMGASKRVAEMYCQGLNTRSKTRYITVRFGNVLGSSGSVIPLFQQQIAQGGPVTVTHPDIQRYFMTIPEACQLILQAGVIGRGGEIFVLDMGEPVKISYLAEQLIRLSGKTPGEDIDIVYTGLRPGEKLYEELFHDAEKLAETSHPKILLAQCRMMDKDALERSLDAMQQACDEGNEAVLRNMLAELVPEHTGLIASTPATEKGAVVVPLKQTKSP
ncbi:multidrug MFS transporter [Sulfuricaulis limicola]|uniref:Multidrug MFS transporter n=1 Tax=Sulfuricaulis limicola TaxID=1620215 RepID=A0A1B4XFG0_9GAMM|nr:nucleoside-diphosphate sugar epimerase/dehydratase [Sulfuricaulis limicola]BAV33543.1 multidrug MFS transporter [Sulfuricaulis limicola]